MSSYYPTPTAIEYHQQEGILRVRFDDDSEVDLDAVYLREHCPCARCQGHSGEHKRIPLQRPQQAIIDDVQPVGNYAMTIRWNDGHDTGIYSWVWLQEHRERALA